MTQMKDENVEELVLTAQFGARTKSIPDVATIKNVVLLSIKNKVECEGVHLGAMVTAAFTSSKNPNQTKFTTFLIADEIHWHNLKSTQEPPLEEEIRLREQASVLGLAYFEAQLKYFLLPLKLSEEEFNQKYPSKTSFEKIKKLNEIAKENNMGYEVIFWRDWVNRAPDIYKQQQKTIQGLYFTEDSLNKSIAEQALKFVGRNKTEKDIDPLKLSASEGYLREESHGVMWLAAYWGYHFISYPGSMPSPFKATKTFFIKELESQTDSAIDSNVFIKTDKPDRLISWQEVKFKDVPANKQPPVISIKSNNVCISNDQPKENKNQFFAQKQQEIPIFCGANLDPYASLRVIADSVVNNKGITEQSKILILSGIILEVSATNNVGKENISYTWNH